MSSIHNSSSSPISFSVDIAFNICSFLYDETLEELYVLGIIPSLPDLVHNPYFWHSRVETLSEIHIPFVSDVDWRQTYSIVGRTLSLEGRPSWRSRPITTCLWNEDDNVAAAEILSRIMFVSDGANDLSACAKHGSLKILRWLLDNKNVDPSRLPDHNRMYCLLAAADEGQYEAVKMLLADKRVDATEVYRFDSALTLACVAKHTDRLGSYVKIVQLLLADMRIDPSWNKSKALWADCYSQNDNVEIIDLLLRDGRADPRQYKNLSLLQAVNKRRVKTLARLLQDPRVDQNVRGHSLIKAVSEGQMEVIKLLLADPRTNPTIDDNSVLLTGLIRGNENVVKLLLADNRILLSIRAYDVNEAIKSTLIRPEVTKLVRDALA